MADPIIEPSPINVSLTFPPEDYAWRVACDAQTDLYFREVDLEFLTKKIICPYEFSTHHPYESSSENLIKKIENWAENNGIYLFNYGCIRGHRWLNEITMEKFNTLHWLAPNEEIAFFVTLVWNGKD